MANKRILVVDDDRVLLRVLEARLSEMGLEVETCTDGLQALMKIVESPPDLLIVDVKLPSADGISICERLASDARYAPIPVIVFSGSAQHEIKEACEALGATYVRKGPESWESLRPAVSYLVGLQTSPPAMPPRVPAPAVPPRPSEPRKPRVLLIDDDRVLARVLEARLKSLGIEASCAFGGMQGFGMALLVQPDVIVSDFNMPEGRANYLLMRLRDHPVTRSIPVIILTGFQLSSGRNFALSRELLSLGAKAFLTKPVNVEAFVREVRRFLPLPAARREPTPISDKEPSHV